MFPQRGDEINDEKLGILYIDNADNPKAVKCRKCLGNEKEDELYVAYFDDLGILKKIIKTSH